MDCFNRASGVSSGIGATLISQPIDTIKTKQQSAPLNQPLSIIRAAKVIYAQNGLYGFFKGGGSRGLSVTAGITVIADIKDRIEKKVLTQAKL